MAAGHSQEEAGGIGWGVCWQGIEGTKGLEKGNDFSIVETADGKRLYCLDSFPALSKSEEKLFCTVQGLFQKNDCCRAKSQDIGKFFKEYCVRNLVFLEKRQVEYFLLLLDRQLLGFGPLDFFLGNDSIEEIAVIGTGKEKPVHVFHASYGWLQTNVFFSSETYAKDVVNKMARQSGRRLSLNSPVLNATLPDGSRLSAAINPVSFSGPSITIRKFRQQPFTPAQLVENNTFNAELMALLWIAMQCDCSILIAGNTGSGKTSSLNALLSFVPAEERIVVVEETPEIKVQQRHFVKLNVVKEQSIGMQNLIVESLRMRPDRIIVGEVRSREEVGAFIDTMLAGQGKGSYATFHAQSALETVGRLRSLGAMQLDLAAIDLVLVQRRWNIAKGNGMKEVRHIVEAAEFIEEENGLPGFNRLYNFDYAKGGLVKGNASARVFEKAKRCFGFSQKEWEQELVKRADFLLRQCSGMQMEEFFRKVNLYGAGKKALGKNRLEGGEFAHV